MQNEPTPLPMETQPHGNGNDSKQTTSGLFKPVTNLRVMLTPPVRARIARRFFRLRQSVRTIARGERMPESVIEQLARERYWETRRDDDTGPFPFPSSRRAA